MENSKNIFKASNFSKDLPWSIGIAGLDFDSWLMTLKFTDFHCPRLLDDSLIFLIYGNGQFSIICEAMAYYHENHFTVS